MPSNKIQSTTTRRGSAFLASIFLAASTGLLGAQAAGASDQSTEASKPQGAEASGPTIVIEHDGTIVSEFEGQNASEAEAALLEQALGEGTATPSTPGAVTPQISFGFGWYTYVYLNSDDISRLATAGASGAAGILCGAGWTGIACAAAAATIVADLPAPPPAGHCVELRFVHGSNIPLPPKVVQRTC